MQLCNSYVTYVVRNVYEIVLWCVYNCIVKFAVYILL